MINKTKRKNPLYRQERHPKRIARWFVANLIALPFGLLFLSTCFFAWFDEPFPWQAAVLTTLFFGAPCCAVCFWFWVHTIVPKYRRSVCRIHHLLSYHEVVGYLSQEVFVPTPYKDLQVSDEWICIKRMFIPKNIVITTALTSVGGGYRSSLTSVVAFILVDGKSAIITMASEDEAKEYLEEVHKALPHAEKLGQTGSHIYFDKKLSNHMRQHYHEYMQQGATLNALIHNWGDFQQIVKTKIYVEALYLTVSLPEIYHKYLSKDRR